MNCLPVGTRFPTLRVSVAGGGTFELPEAFRNTPAVLLFYRGHW
jgi:hypothetical protein